MIGICIATYWAFRSEHEVLVSAERRRRREEMARRMGKTVTVNFEKNFDDHFDDQVDGHIRRRSPMIRNAGHAGAVAPKSSAGCSGQGATCRWRP